MNTTGSALQGSVVQPPDPEVWEEPAMRRALAVLDFRAVYRRLHQLHGFSQQRIGQLTGQSQPEVSAIMKNKGRQVLAVAVVRRIATGLGIPLAYVGLACAECPHVCVAGGV